MTIEPYNYNDEPSGRVDTLAMALDKCERLERQLSVAIKYLKKLTHKEDWRLARQALNEIKELEK